MIKIIFAAAALSLLFLTFGLVVSFFIDGAKGSLSTVLFIIGGILIVFFSPGLFSSSSSGALHTPVVVYRLVNTLSRKRNTTQNDNDRSSVYFSSINLVLAGVILWGVSYFV